MRRILVFAILSTLGSQVCEAGWIYNLHPKDIRANLSPGGITFATVEAAQNPASCSGSEFYGVAFDANGHHKNVLALLLTAQASGRTVAIYVVDTSCYSAGRPLVTDVMVQ
jgi:hypothetical protein